MPDLFFGMKKKIVLAFLIIFVVFCFGIIYLNTVFLPTRIKSLLIESLSKQTHKQVSIDSLRFNILKGLVVKNLQIFDDSGNLVKFQEASCTFLIVPFLKKQIIIPSITIRSATIFLRRKSDNSINLLDLLQGKSDEENKGPFNIVLYGLRIIASRLEFQDNAVSPAFSKNIEDLNIAVNFALPAKIKFKLQGKEAGDSGFKITAVGEYSMSQRQLLGTVYLSGLFFQELSAYYQQTGLTVSAGLADLTGKIVLKDNSLNSAVVLKMKNLVFKRDALQGSVYAVINAHLAYGLDDKHLGYSGIADIIHSELTGLPSLDSISNINGIVRFDARGIRAESLGCRFEGIPVEAKISLIDMSDPLINIEAKTAMDLAALKNILKDKFSFSVPVELSGASNLAVITRHRFSSAGPWEISASLASQDLKLDANFSLEKNKCNFSKIEARYLNSSFSLAKDMTLGVAKDNAVSLPSDLKGILDVDLKDIPGLLKKNKIEWDKIKPEGLIHVNLSLSGNLNDLVSCQAEAAISGPILSAYGLHGTDFFAKVSQAEKVITLTDARLSLYEGMLSAGASLNLDSQNLPYRINVEAENLKLEKLKLDTSAKEKDISGTIQTQVKLNGFGLDLAKLSGAGKIILSDGRFWELNLFKGLGSLLFAKDFEHIMFKDGYCNFSVENKSFISDNIKMISDIAEIGGGLKIGFDGRLEGRLNVNVLNEMVPLTGTFRDVATAVVGQGGRFGVIYLSGTIGEPKYKFKPAVVDIIKGIKDVIFKGG